MLFRQVCHFYRQFYLPTMLGFLLLSRWTISAHLQAVNISLYQAVQCHFQSWNHSIISSVKMIATSHICIWTRINVPEELKFHLQIPSNVYHVGKPNSLLSLDSYSISYWSLWKQAPHPCSNILGSGSYYFGREIGQHLSPKYMS